MTDLEIDLRILKRIFDDFKGAIELESRKIGEPSQFRSFSNLITSKQEGYKTDIFGKGRTILALDTWDKQSIGKGIILENVIQSYSVKNNNLYHWRSLNELKESSKDKKKIIYLENLFFKLYKDPESSPGEIFDKLATIIRHYDAIAYLFFLKDLNQYLPIAPSHFDKFFSSVRSDFRTSGQINWNNYRQYLAYNHEVQNLLIEWGVKDVSLLDAHSFCWMTVNWLKSHPNTELPEPESEELEIDSDCKLNELPHPDPNNPDDSDDTTDYIEKSLRNQNLGKFAERWVLEQEVRRLNKCNKPVLANKVHSVSKKTRLGYDIESFDEDGTPRHIEVKTIQKRRDLISFYISRNELNRGRNISNYWIYCVLGPDTTCPTLRHFPIDKMKPEWLTPTEFFVRIPFKKF